MSTTQNKDSTSSFRMCSHNTVKDRHVADAGLNLEVRLLMLSECNTGCWP